MKNIISKFINVAKPKSLRESSWCGVPNTIYRYHGDWSSPEVEYKGKLYNEWDLQEYIGEIFNDYCEKNNIDIKNDWEEKFGDWLSKNPDYAYTAFEELEPSGTVNNTKFESSLNESAEDNNDIKVYMNTWKNYNEYGADLEAYGIKDGWMTPEEAKEFAEKYADDEPFINDTDNCPIDGVNEYSSLSVLDDLIEYNNLSSDEREVVGAILESGYTDSVSEAVEKVNDGDYVFFPGVSDDKELGEAYVDMCGGITAAVRQEKLPEYFNENEYREEIEDDVRDYIAKDNGYNSIDDVSDDELNTYLDSIVNDDIMNAVDSKNDDFFEAHFDYEALGRELSYDYTYVDAGAICTF